MEAYQTEEQQIEAIKAFWRKNGNQIILGIVIGLGGIYGFRYFQEQQTVAAAEAAQAYADAATPEQLQQFTADYADSGYAAVAELQLAKTQVEAGELEAAAATLKQVAASASEIALQQLAKLRLARVQIALGQADQALQTLSGEWPTSLLGDVESVKAEAHLANGNVDVARDALQTALMHVPAQQAAVIQVRLDDLAVAAPELPAAPTATEE